MKLPNAERAVVDIRKLRDYCLDPASPKGRTKARVFASALGLTQQDAEFFRRVCWQRPLIILASPGKPMNMANATRWTSRLKPQLAEGASAAVGSCGTTKIFRD